MTNKINIHDNKNIEKYIINISGSNNSVLVTGSNNFLKQEAKVFINIKGNNNNVEIGQGNIINRSFSLSFFPARKGVISSNNTIRIKNNSFFNGGGNVFMCLEDSNTIEIGNDCLFAGGISLNTSDYHKIIDLESKCIVNKSGNVTIGDHVWVCNDVQFLPSSGIGSHSVVATRALVTKHFSENNVVIGGVPARIIKTGIDWER